MENEREGLRGEINELREGYEEDKKVLEEQLEVWQGKYTDLESTSKHDLTAPQDRLTQKEHEVSLSITHD